MINSTYFGLLSGKILDDKFKILDDYLVIIIVFLSLLNMVGAIFFALLKITIVFNFGYFLLNWKKFGAHQILGIGICVPFAWAMVIGMINLNVGVEYEIPLFIFAPLGYWLVFARKRGEFFLRNLAFACLVATVYQVAVFFVLLGIPSLREQQFFSQNTGFILQYFDGYNKVYSSQATQLVFLLPFVVLLQNYKNTVLTIVLSFLCLVASFIMARKAIIVSAAMLYICLLAFYSCMRPKDWLRTICMVFAPPLIAIMAFPVLMGSDLGRYAEDFALGTGASIAMDSGSIEQRLTEGKKNSSIGTAPATEVEHNVCDPKLLRDNSQAYGGSVRLNQMRLLLAEISAAPWFGHGAGHVIANCVRAETTPWRFELAWLGLTMNFGFVGLLVIVSVYVFLLSMLLPISSDFLKRVVPAVSNLKRVGELPAHFSVPLLAGSVSFLVASLTNPYMMSVETIWVLFLPHLCVAQFGEVVDL